MSSVSAPSALQLNSAEEFQRVEDAGEIAPEAGPSLLIHGENSAVINALLEDFRGKVDLIYLDPPFYVGSDMTAHLSFGENSAGSSAREGLFKAVAYGDHWSGGTGSYLQMIFERLKLCHELLSERGSLYLHCDYRTTAYMRLLLEEIFGRRNYINECIWHYRTGGMPEKLGYGRKHDTIHYVVKDQTKAIWNPQKEKSYLGHKYGFSNIDVQEDDHGLYTMVNLRDVWNIPALRGNQPERVDYPTQKPEALLDRIIRVSSNEDSIVADLFCGSGTTGAVAERLGRRWIMCDQGELAIHTCRKRLLELHLELKKAGHSPHPFRVYDLGKHDQRLWLERQQISSDDPGYRALVLERLGIPPMAGSEIVHGQLGDKDVHIASVDANVDSGYLDDLIRKLQEEGGQRECFCLAWHFAESSHTAIQNLPHPTQLHLVQIPHEIAELGRKAAPVFFELPHCVFEVNRQLDTSYDVTLRSYVPALPLRQVNGNGITGANPFDHIDMWAVDFNYGHHSHFHYDWYDFRTRRKRTLETTSALHWKYAAAGRYVVAVKIIDVSGVETLATHEIEV